MNASLSRSGIISAVLGDDGALEFDEREEKPSCDCRFCVGRGNHYVREDQLVLSDDFRDRLDGQMEFSFDRDHEEIVAVGVTEEVAFKLQTCGGCVAVEACGDGLYNLSFPPAYGKALMAIAV